MNALSDYFIGPRCDKLHGKTGVRCLYPVYENGILLGFLGMRTGWNQYWRLWKLKIAQPDQWNFEGFNLSLDSVEIYLDNGREGLATREARQQAVYERLVTSKMPRRGYFRLATEIKAEAEARDKENLTRHTQARVALEREIESVAQIKSRLESVREKANVLTTTFSPEELLALEVAADEYKTKLGRTREQLRELLGGDTPENN